MITATSQEGLSMTPRHPEEDTIELMTPAEVAKVFRVAPKTVTQWAEAGKLRSFRTLGGHRRYPTSEVMNLLYGTAR